MAETPLRSALLKGTSWMVVLRWLEHGVAVLSTIILARLLSPADFGLIAMAMLFITLTEVLTTFGVDYALIQRQDASRDHYDTAWSIRLLQYLGLAVLTCVFAPTMARFFADERVTDLMYLLSVGTALKGFESIGTVDFRKSLQFHLEFYFRLGIKLGGFAVTVTLVVLLRSYWALAWGIVATSTATVVLSYCMHGYRPRFTLRCFDDIWSFSKWILVRGLGIYLRRKGPSFVIGRVFDAGALGLYSIALDIAMLPTTAIVQPITRALFPGYAKIAHDRRELGRLYVQTLGLQTMIVLPTSFGLAAIAEPLVITALGEKWLPAAPILAWLSLYYGVATLALSVQPVLTAVGHVVTVAKLAWIQAFLMLPAVVFAAMRIDLLAVAWMQLLVGAVIFPIQFHALKTADLLGWGDVIGQVWRPLVASGVMMLVLGVAVPMIGVAAPLALALKIALGAVTFGGTVLVLWRLSGSPQSSEHHLLQFARQKLPGRGK